LLYLPHNATRFSTSIEAGAQISVFFINLYSLFKQKRIELTVVKELVSTKHDKRRFNPQIAFFLLPKRQLLSDI
jgi:hypothetical protein